jgi:hypothetical protein
MLSQAAAEQCDTADLNSEQTYVRIVDFAR